MKSLDLPNLEALGTGETALTPELLSTLPQQVAPAPWTGHGAGIAWWRPIASGDVDRIQSLVPKAVASGGRPVSVAGFLLSWRDTPVGSYLELGTMIVMRRGWKFFGHVPFIAVDSPASIVGGRANWAVPKTFAQFTGKPGESAVTTATGAGFDVKTNCVPRGPRIPVVLPGLVDLVQARPDGEVLSARATAHGTLRRARVKAEIEAGPDLAAWFPTGDCTGVALNFRRASTGRV